MNNNTPRKITLPEAEARVAAAIKAHRAAQAALLAIHRAGGNDTAAAAEERRLNNEVTIAIYARIDARRA